MAEELAHDANEELDGRLPPQTHLLLQVLGLIPL